ncbi:MAG: isopeptide-forming domain-containing fimbrial protein [Lachnospiraceae bacterium]|nr:isopeptide-forming domain-containing fimbrial protein [Lachnospiraceae bacterium]
MKKLKKLLGLVLALAMVMGISVTAFAASGSESITITGVASENHTFTAYQIFAGTSSGNTLSNVTWGDGVDSTALVTALKNNSTLSTYFTASTYTAEEVAEVLAANNDKAAFANAFSIVVAANVSSTASGTRESATEESGGTYSYTISGLAEGYYIVVDSSTSTGTDQDAVSGYIIKVVAGTTNEIATKAVVPDTSKEVLQDDNGTTSDESDDTYGDYNTGSIGDTVSFKVTSHVPNVSGYTKYYFNVIDTLSKGLTFNNDVVIKIGGVTLDTSSYTVTPITNSDDSTTVTIVFKDAVNLLANYTVGTEITITYSATINEDADMTTNGNTNEVYAIYSNNPTATPVGTGDTPDPEDPVGETPKQTTTTYVTGIQITKVDNDNTSTTLTGAKFSISGTALNVVYVNSEIFKEDTSGTYYRLTDGTYTET